MKTTNVWESEYSKCFKYLNTFEEFEKLVKGTDKYFVIRDKFDSVDKIDSNLEKAAYCDKTFLNYIDDEHQVCISISETFSPCIISSSFYSKYKDKINSLLINNFTNKSYVTVPSFLFSNELLDKLIETCSGIYLEDVTLSNEQIEKIKSKNIECSIKRNGSYEIVNSNKLIGDYTEINLKNTVDYFSFDKPFEEYELNNFSYFQEGSSISFNFFDPNNNFKSKNELRNSLLKALVYLDKQNKKFDVSIIINTRMDIYDILPNIKKLNNIKPVVYVKGDSYTFDEYLSENEKLDNLVENIKNSNLSPLEKYLAVYNIVKKYKPYNDNLENKSQARSLKYVLNNDYMVCAGFANLLDALLERVGIDSCHYGTGIHKFYIDENGASKNTVVIGHARNLIHMVDPKYGVDGIFVADSTWDNHYSKGDTYDFSLLPVDSMQTQTKGFSLIDEDYFLDVHDFSEYNNKVNLLIIKYFKKGFEEYNKLISSRNIQPKVEDVAAKKKKIILKSYENVYTKMMNLLKQIDYNKFLSFEDYNNVEKDDRTEEFYLNFLSEFGNYIVAKTNKEVSSEIIADAASVAVQYQRNKSDDFRSSYSEKVRRAIDSRKATFFPFSNVDEKSRYV